MILKKLVVSLFGLMVISGCALNEGVGEMGIPKEKSPLSHKEYRELDPADPLFNNFVGQGVPNVLESGTYNSRLSSPLESQTVSIDTINRGSVIECSMIEDSSDLTTNNTLSFNVNANADSLFGLSKASASIDGTFKNEFHFNSKTVYMLLKIYYNYGTIRLQKARFKAFPRDTLQDFKDNKNDFYAKYGNAYVNETTLGESIYYLYEFKSTSQTTASMVDLKAALSATFAGITGGASGGDNYFDKIQKDHVEIKSYMKINGDYLTDTSVILDTPEKLDALIRSFSTYIRTTYDTAFQSHDYSHIGELAHVYKKYEDLVKEVNGTDFLCDLDTYYSKLLSWSKLRGKLMKLHNDIKDGVFKIINSDDYNILGAIANVNEKMDLCVKRGTVDFPEAGLYSELLSLTTPVLINPIHKDLIAPGSLTFIWNPSAHFTKYDLYVDDQLIYSGPKISYTVSMTKPGMHSWYVKGYGTGGNNDSDKYLFNIPGFDLENSPVNGSEVILGQNSFVFAPLTSDVTYTLYRNNQIVPITTRNFATIYFDRIDYNKFVLKAEKNGKVVESAPLCLSPLYGAQIVSDTIPSRMYPGQTYNVSVTVENTGNYDWNNADQYKLGVEGAGSTFGIAVRQYLNSTESIGNEATKTFYFTMTAPLSSGSYNANFQMVRENILWFGDKLSKNIEVTLNPYRIYGAQIVSDTIPSVMVAGQSYNVSVTVKNTGNNVWNSADQYKLGVEGAGSTFGITSRQYLSSTESIGNEGTRTFSFTMTAPVSSGSYHVNFQMVHENIIWFGDHLSKSIQIR